MADFTTHDEESSDNQGGLPASQGDWTRMLMKLDRCSDMEECGRLLEALNEAAPSREELISALVSRIPGTRPVHLKNTTTSTSRGIEVATYLCRTTGTDDEAAAITDAITRALENLEGDKAVNLINALRMLGEKAATSVPALAERVAGSCFEKEVLAALEALQTMPEAAAEWIPVYLEKLQSPSAGIRLAALNLTAKFVPGNTDAFDALAEIAVSRPAGVNDTRAPNVVERAQSIIAEAAPGSRRVQDILLGNLSHPDRDVALSAWRYLRDIIMDPDSTYAVNEAVELLALDDKRVRVLTLAMGGKWTEEAALEVLSILETTPDPSDRKGLILFDLAIWFAGRMEGDDCIRQVLQEVIKELPDDDSRKKDVLLRHLEYSDGITNIAAAGELGRMGREDPAIIDQLLAIAREGSPHAAAMALDALGQTGNRSKDVVDTVLEVLNTEPGNAALTRLEYAITCAGKLGSAGIEAKGRLLELLQPVESHPVTGVREEVIKRSAISLAQIDDTDSCVADELLLTYRKVSSEARIGIAIGLGHFGRLAEGAKNDLIACVSAPPRHHENKSDYLARVAAFRALEKIAPEDTTVRNALETFETNFGPPPVSP